MQADAVLTIEAMNLADGADIHKIAGCVAMYRSAAKDGQDYAAGLLERELRAYVVRKRELIFSQRAPIAKL